jgi:hypothetical protein
MFFLASSFYPRHVAHVPSLSDQENNPFESSGDNDTDMEIETPADWLREQLEDLAEENASTMPAGMVVEVCPFPSFHLQSHSYFYRHHHGRT